MAVGSTQPAGDSRPGRAVLQRGLGAAYRLSDLLAQKISAATDPRARMLRQRRRALRWGLVFGAGCAFWMLVTTVLASWSTPAWVLLITGALAAGAAAPATLLLLRYRWLRSAPLPAQRPGTTRRLPPPGSAARPAMTALQTAERGLFSLLGVMQRGAMLPADEIGELTGAADATASAMAATAAEVVSMEQTLAANVDSRSYLAPTIDAFTAQLTTGIGQYNEMVTAAAHVVASASGGSTPSPNSPPSQQHHRHELVAATDRLAGWAHAFEELGRLR
jgi:hypothetical protein